MAGKQRLRDGRGVADVADGYGEVRGDEVGGYGVGGCEEGGEFVGVADDCGLVRGVEEVRVRGLTSCAGVSCFETVC